MVQHTRGLTVNFEIGTVRNFEDVWCGTANDLGLGTDNRFFIFLIFFVRYTRKKKLLVIQEKNFFLLKIQKKKKFLLKIQKKKNCWKYKRKKIVPFRHPTRGVPRGPNWYFFLVPTIHPNDLWELQRDRHALTCWCRPAPRRKEKYQSNASCPASRWPTLCARACRACSSPKVALDQAPPFNILLRPVKHSMWCFVSIVGYRRTSNLHINVCSTTWKSTSTPRLISLGWEITVSTLRVSRWVFYRKSFKHLTTNIDLFTVACFILLIAILWKPMGGTLDNNKKSN